MLYKLTAIMANSLDEFSISGRNVDGLVEVIGKHLLRRVLIGPQIAGGVKLKWFWPFVNFLQFFKHFLSLFYFPALRNR